MDLIGWVYVLVALALGLYSANMFILAIIFWVYRFRSWFSPGASGQNNPTSNPWPAVTIQLPMFNEQHVARRLIDAVAQLDYPAGQLQIQVLDDSTDNTREIVAEAVCRWKRQGINIEEDRRLDRADYKAGAMNAGMKTATGEYIAVFDADFVPAGLAQAGCPPFYRAGQRKIGPGANPLEPS
jgi:cellulose synthase/poly-beta-1,6-N-acetylglucosamine synthase-like glycosyltransferase